MKLYLLLLIGWLSVGATEPAYRVERTDVQSLLSKEQYEQFFPHHHPLYSYESFIKAAASFPLFAGEGDPSQRKRELAAFFAHASHETTNGGAGARGGPYAWGLYYTDEQACLTGHCSVYSTAGTSPYQPVAGKSYHGRGPLQLSYAYNYGLAGAELGLPLLAKPELVSHDGVVAFKTAIWFWMRAQKPKPSCHDVICGKWQPDAEDQRLGRVAGFGMTINIINGGVECKSQNPEIKGNREDRIGFYKYFAGFLQVPVEKDCDCATMAPYGN
ncbi:MAG: hypothetical protein JST68_19385 [Bacteroidetes bacterium]|nr:hypothetical protein [Bacteroidota bacterium]